VNSREVYYYKRIVALGQARGATVSFFDMPGAYRGTLDPVFAAAVERKYGIKLYVMPLELQKKVQPRGFADHAHFNTFGQRFYTEWLAKAIELPR
jgi:hypothetical protein